MRLALTSLLLVAGLVATVAAAPGTGEPSAVFLRMQHVNAGLRSYQADVHVDVTTHGLLSLLGSPTLQGKAYFQQPDKNAVIFDSLPALASQFKKVYPQLEPPSQWPQVYDVILVADDGSSAQFRLVPKKEGRVDRVEVEVDDRTATVTSMAYIYKDGGSIAFRQTYVVIGGNYVVSSQTGKVDIPHYSADVASSFTHYKLNVPIDPQVFATD